MTFITKSKDGCNIFPVSNISVIVVKPDEVDDRKINNVQIVALPQLTKYKSCMHCKARVESSNPPFGRCSKENCNMYQKYDVCKMQLSVKLLFMNNNGEQVALYAFGQTVLDLAKARETEVICEEAFLQLPPLSSITFNKQNMIIKFTHSE